MFPAQRRIKCAIVDAASNPLFGRFRKAPTETSPDTPTLTGRLSRVAVKPARPVPADAHLKKLRQGFEMKNRLSGFSLCKKGDPTKRVFPAQRRIKCAIVDAASNPLCGFERRRLKLRRQHPLGQVALCRLQHMRERDMGIPLGILFLTIGILIATNDRIKYKGTI